MEKRELGKTGMEVSRLGFDTTPLRAQEFKQAQAVLNIAYDCGIRLYTTGRGDQDSEIKLGYGLNLRRHDVAVLAKTHEVEGHKVARAIERSIRNLHTDYIDIYEIDLLFEEGKVDLALGEDGALNAMRKAKEEGKIRLSCAASLRPGILERLVPTGQVDAVQFPVNIFDLDFARRLFPLVKEKGVGVIGCHPFAEGTFGDPHLALPFVLDQETDAVMAGMSTVAQVRENAAAADNFKPLSDAEREMLEEVGRTLGRDYCRLCGECMPCERGIDVVKIMEMLRASWRFHLRDWAKGVYSSLAVKPSACDECGECEKRCRYKVNVISLLGRAARHFA